MPGDRKFEVHLGSESEHQEIRKEDIRASGYQEKQEKKIL
jgi:hypothetical protein